MKNQAQYFALMGVFLGHHSDYKGFKIYRQWNAVSKGWMMSYFAIKWEDPENIMSTSRPVVEVHARNLAGIKAAVKNLKVS